MRRAHKIAIDMVARRTILRALLQSAGTIGAAKMPLARTAYGALRVVRVRSSYFLVAASFLLYAQTPVRTAMQREILRAQLQCVGTIAAQCASLQRAVYGTFYVTRVVSNYLLVTASKKIF